MTNGRPLSEEVISRERSAGPYKGSPAGMVGPPPVIKLEQLKKMRKKFGNNNKVNISNIEEADENNNIIHKRPVRQPFTAFNSFKRIDIDVDNKTETQKAEEENAKVEDTKTPSAESVEPIDLVENTTLKDSNRKEKF